MLCFDSVQDILWSVGQQFCKENAKVVSRVKLDQCEIRISKLEFEQNFHDNELWVNGFLYDVGSYYLNGETIIAYCYQDNEEQNFITRINEYYRLLNGDMIWESGSHFTLKNICHAPNWKIATDYFGYKCELSQNEFIDKIPYNIFHQIFRDSGHFYESEPPPESIFS